MQFLKSKKQNILICIMLMRKWDYFTRTHTHMHTHAHWRRNVLQWDQRIRAAGFRENGKYTSLFFFSFWPSGAYFIPHKIVQACGQVNTKSHSWSPTAWTWIEAVCSLIQSFWMRGISYEQRNKQTEKVVESCRLSRISERTYSGLGSEWQTDAKLFLASAFSVGWVFSYHGA